MLNNRLIAEFMGYIYYHPGVDIDDSDIGGVYTRKEIFSKVPIKVDEYPEDDQFYFSRLPNPDFRKENPKMWNPEIEELDWNSINHNEYITDLQYHLSWDWLMVVVEKIYLLREVDSFIMEPGEATIILKNGKLFASPHLPTNSFINEVYQVVADFIRWYNRKNTN